MTTAFQDSAFQSDTFQIDGGVVVQASARFAGTGALKANASVVLGNRIGALFAGASNLIASTRQVHQLLERFVGVGALIVNTRQVHQVSEWFAGAGALTANAVRLAAPTLLARTGAQVARTGAVDIRLVQSGEFPYQTEVSADWLLLADGTLDDTQALATAVIVALGTDRLAREEDVPYLPDPDSTDRRGWWADFDAQEIWQGWPIGSRLWTLKRDKITGPGAQRGSSLVRIKWYIQEALQPFVDLRICSRYDVEVRRIDRQRIDALIRMYRGPELAIDLRYQVLWEDITPQGAMLPYLSGGPPTFP